jgi:HSP20 family molecular chaperone IbpA
MALGTLIHRQPARRLVRGDFDRLMDDLWSGFGLAPLAPDAPRTVARNGSPGSPSGEGESEARYTPRLDAVELEDEYRVTAELPGVDAKDFDVTVEEGVLSIKGERRTTSTSEEGEERESKCSFHERVRFPGEVDATKVSAAYRNGVLTVHVPKATQPEPEVRSIPVQSS